MSPRTSVGRLVVAVAVAWVVAATVQAAPGIAIFSDPSFPYFAAPGLAGQDVQAWFSRIGVKADLLDANALADPKTFNADRYAALVWLYGNTFPKAAADNLRAFHQHGGGFVSAGVPFCHPCVQKGAEGWGWSATPDDVAEVTPEAAHTGRYGVLVEKHGPGWTGLIQDNRIPARPGETFTLGGWAKTRDTTPDDAILLRFWSAAGKFLGQVGPGLPKPGGGGPEGSPGDWTFVSREVTTPPDTAAVDVIVVLWKAPATMWLDDLVLVRGALKPGAKNLLPNPGFERLGGPWTDLGHIPYFGHDKIGTGNFYDAASPTDMIYHAADDPLGLAVLDWPARRKAFLANRPSLEQTLDPRSLPPEDKVVPILEYRDAAGVWPALAIVQHHCPQFPGAIDVWAGVETFAAGSLDDLFAQLEVYGRGALYILHERGALPNYAALLKRADAAYRASLPASNLTPVAARHNYDGVFPPSARPARRMVVADVSALPLDEKLALVSLEGVINSKQPRLYLITDAASATADKPSPEQRWLDWLKQRGDIDEIERVANPWSLVKRWPGEIKGVIITDPKLPASINMATMMCGLDSAIMVSPALAAKLKLPVIADLRGRWKTNVAADEWAIANLWPKLNHDFLGLMWPGWIWPRDYIIAHKAFCFWITGVKDAVPGVGSPLQETAVMSKLLARAPVNIGVVGAPWAGDGVGIQEGPGVTLLSNYGKFMVWSAETGNLSVHSGTRPPVFRHAIPPPPPLDRSKVYLSFMVSDGDAPINWCGFFLTRYWDDPARGTFPLAWSFGPTGADLMPDLMDYYYRKAGPKDTFVCAVSGVGYCYPSAYATRYAHRQSVFDGFLALTAKYMRRVDERGVWTHSTDNALLKRYAAAIPGLKYFLPDYGLQPGTTIQNMDLTIDGIPAFHAICGFDPKGGPEQAKKIILDDIRRFTPKTRPAFLNAFVQCYPCSPTLIKQVLDELGPDYVPVLPEHLAALYLEAHKH